MRVVNVRGLTPNAPGVVYVGRACRGWPQSPLANPVVLAREADRPAVLAAYEAWLAARIEADDRAVVTALLDLPADAALGCWCHPRPCHADLIVRYARRLREGG